MNNNNQHNLGSNGLEEALFVMFKNNADSVVLADLSEKIVNAILLNQRAAAILKLFVGGFLSLASLIVSILIWRYESLAFANSGVSRLLSLLVSDFSAVMGFWKEYLLSLVESLPLVPLSAVMAFIWLCMVNLRFALKNYSFLTHHAAKRV